MSIRSKTSVMPLDRSRPHHTGVLFVQGVPETTKANFKAACAKRGETMRDALIDLMRVYISRDRQVENKRRRMEEAAEVEG